MIPIRKKKLNTLSDTAYELIKSEIVTCILDPGQFIVQTELAEKFGVGLTPVREALRRLAQEGFVHVVPRMGYIISQITPQDIYEIYELRLILETAAARLAATRALDSALNQLAQTARFTYTFKDRSSYINFLNHNAKFHISIAASSGNQRLAMAVAKVMDQLTRIFHLGLDLRDSAEEMRADHQALVKALQQRDTDLAEAHTRAEIIRSRERVLEALECYPNVHALKGGTNGKTN